MIFFIPHCLASETEWIEQGLNVKKYVEVLGFSKDFKQSTS